MKLYVINHNCYTHLKYSYMYAHISAFTQPTYNALCNISSHDPGNNLKSSHKSKIYRMKPVA